MAAGVLGGTSLGLRAAEEEGKEVHIKFNDAPEAVQKTLTAEARGAKIDGVDKETMKDGKEIYEADAVIDGTNYEIQVSPDGKLISKKIDKEEDEKKGAKDKKDSKGKD
jgi:hypothetical protein